MTYWKTIGALFAISGPIALFMYGEFKPNKPRKGAEFNEVRIVTPIKAPPKKLTPPAPQPARSKQEAPKKPSVPAPSPDTIKAMHIQADAERAIAEALQRRADREPDTVKRARIERQVANSWLRFNKILDQIDKLTTS